MGVTADRDRDQDQDLRIESTERESSVAGVGASPIRQVVWYELEFKYAKKNSEERRAMIEEWNKERDKEIDEDTKMKDLKS